MSHTRRRTFQQQINECRLILIDLCDTRLFTYTLESLSPSMAKTFIEETVLWNHPASGFWVNAPNHSKRIVFGRQGWEISFGANKFYISLAISKCVRVIDDLLNKFVNKEEYLISDLKKKLFHEITTSVGDYKGDLYPSPYNTVDSKMIFGVTAIQVEYFVDLLIFISRIRMLYNHEGSVNKITSLKA